jgi:AGCS family alanine or glycine:cation symporter
VQELERILESVAAVIWSPPMLVLLFGTHLYLTFRLRFIQRYIVKAVRISFERTPEGEGDVSQFGAVTTALAATIGTGNIVGVATAIAAGGPGAVLWIWLTGIFGIATKYAEALLSVKYRIRTAEGAMAGGPMYVLERAMNARWLGILYAIFTAICAIGIGNMVQANSLASLVEESTGIARFWSGLVMMVLTAFVILGGIQSIARVCEGLVPFMAIFYTVGCFILLAANASQIPDTIATIVSGALSGQAAIGGFAGAGMREAVRFGIARGLFTNEAGIGSAAIVAAAAQTRNPVRQALVSSTGVFWDTVVMCLITGLVIVNSGEWKSGAGGAALTNAVFADLPIVGPIVLTVGLLTFVFATIIGWSYYGEKAVEYLFGPRAIVPYRWAWVAAVMLGSLASLPIVWAMADITNALMALPNLISLLVLTKVVVDDTQEYLWSGRLEETAESVAEVRTGAAR